MRSIRQIRVREAGASRRLRRRYRAARLEPPGEMTCQLCAKVRNWAPRPAPRDGS